MKTLKDAKITKAIINERRELQVTLIVKSEDYDDVTAELLRNAKIEWNTLDFTITGLTLTESEQERKNRLQVLVMTMKEYASKFHIEEEMLKQNLYNRYDIRSRSELSLAEIDAEIESYKAAILIGIS